MSGARGAGGERRSPGDSGRGALELRGPASALLDEPLALTVRGLGEAAGDELLWRGRLRDDDGRVWRATAADPLALAHAWTPGADAAGRAPGRIAALQSLRPLTLDLRAEAADGRAAARSFTRVLLAEGVRVRRWRDPLAATLFLPAERLAPTALLLDASDAVAGSTRALAAPLAAALLASRGVLTLVVPPGRGKRAVAIDAAAALLAQLASGADVEIAPPPLPPGVPGVGEEDADPAAWDALLARLGARGRAKAAQAADEPGGSGAESSGRLCRLQHRAPVGRQLVGPAAAHDRVGQPAGGLGAVERLALGTGVAVDHPVADRVQPPVAGGAQDPQLLVGRLHAGSVPALSRGAVRPPPRLPGLHRPLTACRWMLHGNTMFAVSAAIDAALVCAFVLWAVRWRPRPPWLLGGLVLVGVALWAKLTLMVAGGLGRPFGVAHVLYLDVVVVVPLAALLLALLRWRDGGWLVRAIAVAGLLLAPVGAYASFVEPQRLVVERAEVPLAPTRAGEQAITVAVLADLQFERLGDHERKAVDRTLELRPDVILLAGDYQQGSRASFERELPGLRRLMTRLRAPGGVYAVQGDQEPSIADTRRIFDGTGVRLLVDESVSTTVGDRRLTIAGLELNHRSPAARATITRLERATGEDDVRILLTHRPDPLLRLARDSRVDLLVAGHTHGGQIQLPLIGAFRTASAIPREIAGGGLHTLDGRRVYVSRGIGVERGEAPKLRFNAPPEVSLLELR